MMMNTERNKAAQVQWLIDGGLVYSLECGVNHNEINVTMVDGSRDTTERHALARAIAAALQSAQPAQPIGTVRHWNIGGSGFHVSVDWNGQPPANGMQLFAATPAQDKQDTAGDTGDLEWHKESLRRHAEKLAAVWEGIREAVQKYSGKPCEGEPFDRLDELLASLSSTAVPAGSQDKDAIDAAMLDWFDKQGYAYGTEDMHEGNRWMIDGPFASLRDAIDAAMQAQGGGKS